MKHGNERRTHVKFPVFQNYDIEVVVAKDPHRARKVRNHKYGVFPDKFYAIHAYNNNGSAVLIFPPEVGVVVIAHECWHAVRAMMEWAGVSLDNECVAYHLGYLTQKVYDFVGREKCLK